MRYENTIKSICLYFRRGHGIVGLWISAGKRKTLAQCYKDKKVSLPPSLNKYNGESKVRTLPLEWWLWKTSITVDKMNCAKQGHISDTYIYLIYFLEGPASKERTSLFCLLLALVKSFSCKSPICIGDSCTVFCLDRWTDTQSCWSTPLIFCFLRCNILHQTHLS